MRGKTFRVVVFLVVCLFSILAWSDCGMAQQQTESKPAMNPLVRVLQAKGILTADDVAQITQASSANDADQRLAKLLLMKGVITQADYDQTIAVPGMMNASSAAASSPTAIAAPAPAPPVVPAFAPTRVLPVGLMGRESVKPIISAGPIRIQPYGFFKMNVIEDSSMPTGGDAPLSGMLVANTGADRNPEFHLNARASRFGANF